MYIDGYVIPVLNAKREAYLASARSVAPIFREHGALKVVETWGDDVPHGKNTDFFMAVKCEEGENVVFSWIVWPDKATRDAGWENAMADPRMQARPDPVFDAKRIIYGGFAVLLEA
jgi:uncharacterized protein YbaA (DUF1428 family)